MKRILAFLVCAMMLMVTFGSVSLADTAEIVDGKFTTTRSITVEIYDRSNDGGSDPTNNVFTKFIKDGMLRDHNVDVTFVTVPRWTEVEALGNLLASKAAPDICVTYSYPTIQTYAGMEGVTDLAPLLEQYKDMLPNLWKLLGDTNIYWDKDPTTNQLWAIEAILANAPSPRINTFIRKDWLDKLSLALPTTTEEFEAALVAFRDNAETLLGADKDKMVPFSMGFDVGWRSDFITASFVPSAAADKDLYINGFDDRHLLYPGYKEGIRLLNKWYNDNLIWKDFALYPSGDPTEDNMMKAGYVGAFIHNWDYPYRNGEDSIIANLKRNAGEDANYVAINCFKNDEGKYLKFLSNSIDRKVFLPATNDEPLASLLYLDWISTFDNYHYLQVGENGINSEVQANGAVKTMAVQGEYIQNSGMNIDYTITLNGLKFEDKDLQILSTALTYPGISEEDVMNSFNASLLDGRVVKNYNVGAISAEEGIGTSLTDKRDAFLCQSVSAAIDQFDAIYDAGMADYLASGGQAIIDERAKKVATFYPAE